MDFPGMSDFLKRYAGARGAGEGRSARLLPAAVQLRDRPDARAGGHRHQEPRPQGARRLPAQERDEDHRRHRSATTRTASGRTPRVLHGPVPRRRRTRTSSSSAAPASRSSSRRPSSRPAYRRSRSRSAQVARFAAGIAAAARVIPGRAPVSNRVAASFSIVDLAAYEAVISGVLLGCFYAAVSIGLSVAFGLLDVPHIAHPSFLVLGAYGAYMLGQLGHRPAASPACC